MKRMMIEAGLNPISSIEVEAVPSTKSPVVTSDQTLVEDMDQNQSQLEKKDNFQVPLLESFGRIWIPIYPYTMHYYLNNYICQ